MHVRTATAVLNASADRSFAFLANPMNARHWATEFVQDMEIDEGDVWATTPMGRMLYRVDADRETGVVDILLGPDAERLGRIPARVIPLGPDRSAFLFTMSQGPGTDEATYEAQWTSLGHELRILEKRFEHG